MIEYIAITIGLIVLGDMALIPVVYLALFGHLNLQLVLLLSFIISNTMDIFWYHLGKDGLGGIFRSFSFIEKYEKNHPQIMEMFFKHQLKIIFLSRFLSGSGISIMVLSGIYKVPFKKYMLMNFLSSLVVVTLVPIITFFAKTSTYAIFDNIRMIEWIVALVVLIIFLSIRFELRAIINKILFREKKIE